MAIVDVLVVGAGFAGCTAARVLADGGYEVLIKESRSHLGGNAYDSVDRHGVIIHPYGPHIFHTGSDVVLNFLSRFTQWRPYQHRVLARLPQGLLPVPINLTTLSAFYGIPLDNPAEAQALLDRIREPVERPINSEQVVLSSVGRALYEAIFRGYTTKQWGIPPSALDAQVTARIPVRIDTDDRYFQDRHQCMPLDGYTALFRQMVNHPRINVELDSAFNPTTDRPSARHIVYTGPVDAFFDHRFGQLPYRSLRFEHSHLPASGLVQPVAVINEPDQKIPYTRTTEFRHLTGQEHTGTSLVREFPQSDGDPYYPVPSRESQNLHARYAELAEAETAVTFIGRLAQYKYFNMDQVVASALQKASALAEHLS